MLFDDLTKKYSTFIFDFDGVIADTNEIKKGNVMKAVSPYLELDEASAFVTDFVSKNGIPREIKFKDKFGNGHAYQNVLSAYESLNKISFSKTKLINGVEAFIKKLKFTKKEIIILSGGQKSEIDSILKSHNLLHYFNFIFSGPSNKNTNFLQIKKKTSGPMIYFGDSQQDYILSTENELDFIFVSSRTQFKKWQKVIDVSQRVRTIHDFIDINY